MKRVLIAKQVSETKWKVQKRYKLERKDWFNLVITFLTVSIVFTRCLVG